MSGEENLLKAMTDMAAKRSLYVGSIRDDVFVVKSSWRGRRLSPPLDATGVIEWLTERA